MSQPSARGYRWAELLRRTFRLRRDSGGPAEAFAKAVDIDVLACPRCGGWLVPIALFEQPEVIARILAHLGLPSELPRPAPARSRGRGEGMDPWWQDDVPVWTEPA